MGGPIIKKLVDSAVINNDTLEFRVKMDGRTRLRVYCTYNLVTGTADMELTVRPVFPGWVSGSGGTGIEEWPDFSDLNADGTADSTLPAVVPNEGFNDFGGTNAAATGHVFVNPDAIVSEIYIKIQNKSSTNARTILVAELI